MKRNFEEAIDLPGIDRDEIHNLEEKKFVDLLIGGIVDEQDGNWERAIERLEGSIKQYIFDENQCRAFSEGEFDHGFLPDFITAIGNHFTYALYCNRNCTMGMLLWTQLPMDGPACHGGDRCQTYDGRPSLSSDGPAYHGG
ncbi:uncharacterized protein LOC118515202 [Anopheles stephensi]|uniref:uncharacterized protein LOC118515202 n=1 Tax=Anopheles stephensi TaxID=30069 RepID=UPI001658B829|nr:uncharacterized protein LOC118515202 [Anopheles stephensi]